MYVNIVVVLNDINTSNNTSQACYVFEANTDSFQRRAHTASCMLGNIHPPTLGKKYNAHLLVFMWKMIILTDLIDVYIPHSISSRI